MEIIPKFIKYLLKVKLFPGNKYNFILNIETKHKWVIKKILSFFISLFLIPKIIIINFCMKNYTAVNL